MGLSVRIAVVLSILMTCHVLTGAEDPYFEFFFEGPDAVDATAGEGASFRIEALIGHSQIGDPTDGIEAWSMSIAVEGATVTGAEPLGEAAGNPEYGEPDFRDIQFESVPGGVLMAVVLDFDDDESLWRLRDEDSPHTVLGIDLAAAALGDEPCARCALHFIDGL